MVHNRVCIEAEKLRGSVGSVVCLDGTCQKLTE